MQLDLKSNRSASLRLARAESLLNQAGRQLNAAIHAAPDRYQQQRLRRLLSDLRELSSPLAGLISYLVGWGGR